MRKKGGGKPILDKFLTQRKARHGNATEPIPFHRPSSSLSHANVGSIFVLDDAIAQAFLL